MSADANRDLPSVGFKAKVDSGGLDLSVKSRFASAIDALLGRKVERMGIDDERAVLAMRREEGAKDRLVEAAITSMVSQIEGDPELARRATNALINGALESQTNREEVGRLAAEQLISSSSSPAQPETRSTEMDAAFTSSFIKYAENASTNELRERWAKVLSTEVLRPGTFSRKVMRVIDEIEPETALKFERLCETRLGGEIPTYSSTWLTFSERLDLIDAGLIIDPGFTGMSITFQRVSHPSEEIFLYQGERFAVGFPTSTEWKKVTTEDFLNISDDNSGEEVPSLSVYILTAAGAAIAEIMQDKEEISMRSTATKLAAVLDCDITLLKTEGDAGFRKIDVVKKPR